MGFGGPFRRAFEGVYGVFYATARLLRGVLAGLCLLHLFRLSVLQGSYEFHRLVIAPTGFVYGFIHRVL